MINWGFKIAMVYILFVIMILYFLFVASQQSNELVEDHYYEKELQFQSVLNAGENLTRLNIKPSIKIDNQQLQISVPNQVGDRMTNGKIEFIRMSDKRQDILAEFKINQAGHFNIPVNKFIPGLYQLKIKWLNNGIPYYYQEQFNYTNP